MPHPTASPYYPTSFSFPKEPVPSKKPPAERVHQPMMGTTLASATDGLMNEDTPQLNYSDIHLLSQNRKPSLCYQNSGFRDSPSRPVHRNYRYLVVVVPPPRLIQEHGQFGHTLSSGPPHRLSQGIIMPLFPTMYGQLNAIAKEFNFPSTTGLCLYLQLNEDGVAVTPRISDESWYMLWSNLFDAPSVGRGQPIGGRIEFDIDFGQARWHSSWLSTLSQDHIERSTSRGLSFSHTHRGSVNEDGYRDLDGINSHLPHPRSTSVSTRHVPRKLSLVDRFDIANGGQEFLDPGQSKAPPKALSPIVQEDEPKSARHQLDDRVRSWRASSQAGLEPIDLSNHAAPDDNPPTNPELELNLEDFTWSISSLGPGDYEVMSVDSSPNCLLSPDIANRMLDDSPPTPSTATSWGAPSYCLSSQLEYFESVSLDLGIRNIFSRPLTPATMTSWGPASPAASVSDWYSEVVRPRSVHLCERGVFSRPATPSTATSWGAPLSYPPTPITPYHVSTPDAAQRAFDHAKETGTFVSHLGSVENTWKFVWPYLKVADISTVKVTRGQGYPEFSIYPPVYPNFDLYPPPPASTSTNQQIDAADSQPGTIFVAASQFPQFNLYPCVSSHSGLYSVEEGCITSYGAYPNLTLYPAIYPYFDLYPGTAAEARLSRPGSELAVNANFPGLYPYIHIYSPAYPNFQVYPAAVTSKGDKDSGVTFLSSSKPEIITEVHRYPIIPIIRPYASTYPHLELYPPVMEVQNYELPVKQCALLPGGTDYPAFNLYPPLAGLVEAVSQPQYYYPFIQLYPPRSPHPTVHNNAMGPQVAQILPQSLTGVAAATMSEFSVTRRRKSHQELHKEVFRSDTIRGSDGAGSDIHHESLHRFQDIKSQRDNRRITMTRSPTGPAFHKPAIPPALPRMSSKTPSLSTTYYNTDDSHPTNNFDGATVHQMAISSARHRSPTMSSPPRIILAAAQRALVVPPNSTDPKLHHSSDVGVNAPRMALAGLNRPDSTGNEAELIRGGNHGNPCTA